MAAAIGATFLLSLSGTLIPAPAVSNNIGKPVILTDDALDGGGAGSYVGFTTADEVADYLAASKISATTAANLNAALSQDARPSAVYVVTYGAGVPSDALDLAIASGLDLGGFMLQTVTESALETLAVWLSASADRKARYFMVAQSADTGLYGGSKPASLSDLEQFGCRVFYSADAQPTAAAYLGRISGADLTVAPPAALFRALNVLPSTATSPQVTAILANDASCIDPLDYGSSASQRTSLGTKSYDGSDWSSALRLIYICRQLRATMLNLWLDAAITGNTLIAAQSGFTRTDAAAEGVLGALPASYFVPQPTAPKGYTVVSTATPDGDDVYITCTVVCWFGREATKIAIPVTGREV